LQRQPNRDLPLARTGKRLAKLGKVSFGKRVDRGRARSPLRERRRAPSRRMLIQRLVLRLLVELVCRRRWAPLRAVPLRDVRCFAVDDELPLAFAEGCVGDCDA
jgi:hypothetical protein